MRISLTRTIKRAAAADSDDRIALIADDQRPHQQEQREGRVHDPGQNVLLLPLGGAVEEADAEDQVDGGAYETAVQEEDHHCEREDVTKILITIALDECWNMK